MDFLRHTYATMMLEMDVHLTTIQKHVGHSSIRVTSDIYSHLSNRIQDTAGAAMDSVLAPRLAPYAKPDPDASTARSRDAQ